MRVLAMRGLHAAAASHGLHPCPHARTHAHTQPHAYAHITIIIIIIIITDS
jgi:hypothetical protein